MSTSGSRTRSVDRSRHSTRRSFAILVLSLFAILAMGCSKSSNASSASTADDPVSGSLTVSAAASLQAAFTEIRTAFTAVHPGVNVAVNFGASSTLAQQIIAGAPVDVFASADQANMTKVSDAKLVSGTPAIFATNSLEIIVRKGNPLNITALADLSKSGLIYVTCSTDVPIGKYASRSLQMAGVSVKPSSLEPDVKGIVTKVTSGEADAGIVYAADVTATNSGATGVVIPPDLNVKAMYPIATISTTGNAAAARAWIDFVTGAEGRKFLQRYGFGSP
jgi:molybdate transport system substrate-binding protein